MSKKKKVIPIAIGTALLLTIIPYTFENAQGSIVSTIKENKDESNIKVEKLKKPNESFKIAKTIVKGQENKKEGILTIDEAEKKAKDILEEFFKITISTTTPVKTNVIVDEVFETSVGNSDEAGSIYKVKINKEGFVLSVESNLSNEELSKNYKVDVDKSKQLVEKFLEKHARYLTSNTNIILTKNSNIKNNILEYKIQRIHNNVEVLEEGGSIIIDAEKMKIISFNATWSDIDFEEEVGNKLNKKEAINILKQSSSINPYYINTGNGYKLNFSLSHGEEHIIDVSKREVKNIFNDEYTVKGNVAGKVEKLKIDIKTKEDIKKVSLDIIKAVTGKSGEVKSTKTIQENGKSLIRCIIGTNSNERYYIEYDSKTFKVINIYKYGYDTLEKSDFKAIEFKEAYKNAIVAIGLVYNKELKNINLNQKEYSLSNSRVYNFTFNRVHNKSNVKDQYISVNIDALTGEVLSIFLEWNTDSKFYDSGKKDIEKVKDNYLNNLKGKYVYINENGIGKLYYILKSKTE